MAQFAYCHLKTSGEEIFINLDVVVSMRRNEEHGYTSFICLPEVGLANVTETPDEILAAASTR
jgi:hypothetical protein